MREKLHSVYNDNLSNLDFLTIPKIINNGERADPDTVLWLEKKLKLN